MIDIKKTKEVFLNFLDRYKGKKEPGFDLKVKHTYCVCENAKIIAIGLNLSDEDVALAELIGLLHDIGRFAEITYLKTFDSVCFDHAAYGVKMLFEDKLIRDFIDDNSYDEIIKQAINNHSRFAVPDGLDERTLLHSKIIRDADKLDNFRVKKDEKIEDMFPGIIESIDALENSKLSDSVYQSVLNKECVNIKNRVFELDYVVCVLAFIFDLNFKRSFEIIKDNDYINVIINRFNYKNNDVKEKMEDIRNIMNDYINEKIKVSKHGR